MIKTWEPKQAGDEQPLGNLCRGDIVSTRFKLMSGGFSAEPNGYMPHIKFVPDKGYFPHDNAANELYILENDVDDFYRFDLGSIWRAPSPGQIYITGGTPDANTIVQCSVRKNQDMHPFTIPLYFTLWDQQSLVFTKTPRGAIQFMPFETALVIFDAWGYQTTMTLEAFRPYPLGPASMGYVSHRGASLTCSFVVILQ